MTTKIKRFYNKIPKLDKKKVDQDFDNIDDFMSKLSSSIKSDKPRLSHEPLKEAFRTRLEVVLYQSNFRAFYLLKGIITELNADNLPAALPLIRSLYELMIQLGYLCRQINNHDDLEYLLSGPIHKIMLGNKNDGAGALAIGKVESVSILTMLTHAEKVFNSISPDEEEKEVLTNFYADLSNQCHPNYNSHMYFTSLDETGKLIGLEDIGEDMASVKALTYPMYMGPLQSAIDLYCLFMDRIIEDPKVTSS